VVIRSWFLGVQGDFCSYIKAGLEGFDFLNDGVAFAPVVLLTSGEHFTALQCIGYVLPDRLAGFGFRFKWPEGLHFAPFSGSVAS